LRLSQRQPVGIRDFTLLIDQCTIHVQDKQFIFSFDENLRVNVANSFWPSRMQEYNKY